MPNAEPVDLTNCDREPIHVPGSIQPHGFVLMLDEDSRLIAQASENVADFMRRIADEAGLIASVPVASDDPEGFLRGCARAGLFEIEP